MLLDEYILLAVECQLHNEKDNEIQTLLEKHTKTGKIQIQLCFYEIYFYDILNTSQWRKMKYTECVSITCV